MKFNPLFLEDESSWFILIVKMSNGKSFPRAVSELYPSTSHSPRWEQVRVSRIYAAFLSFPESLFKKSPVVQFQQFEKE